MLARAITSGIDGVSPGVLFQNNEPGVWFDPSDLKTLYQDSAGTTPVTGVEQPVGKMLDKSGNNKHATQSTAGSRPTLSARYNMLVGTDTLSTQTATTLAANYTLSFSGAGTITLSGTASGTYSAGTSIFTATAGTLTLTVNGQVTNAQLVATEKSHPQGLTYGSELVTNGSFESGLIGAKTDGSGSVSTWTLNTTAPISGSQDGRLAITTSASNRPHLNFTSAMSIPQSGSYVLVSFAYKVNSGTFILRDIGVKTLITSFTRSLTGAGTVSVIVPSGTNDAFGLIIYSGASLCDVQIDNISVREITNVSDNRFPYQSVTSSTVYDSDKTKFPWFLRCTDHWMVTPSIDASAFDKVAVFAAIRKMSDAASAVFCEFSQIYDNNNGSFALIVPAGSGAQKFRFISKGSTVSYADATSASFSAPICVCCTGLGAVSSDSAVLRLNSLLIANTQTDQGAGNFGNYALYIGKRAGTSLQFNGFIYGFAVRFVSSLPNDNVISAIEKYYAAKAGIKI